MIAYLLLEGHWVDVTSTPYEFCKRQHQFSLESFSDHGHHGIRVTAAQTFSQRGFVFTEFVMAKYLAGTDVDRRKLNLK